MQPTVLITPYEVHADADEPFIADWERRRHGLLTEEGITAVTLLRALRDDVALRFVDIARLAALKGRAAGDDPAYPTDRAQFRAHPGRYEVIHEDGAPDGAEGVVLVNCFQVPAGADEAFLNGWHPAREFLTTQHGYLGTRLHRSLAAADFRFVNYARWSSPLTFTRAVGQEEFRRASGLAGFVSHPALYEIIRT